MRATGCYPDRQSTRDRELVECNYGRSVESPGVVVTDEWIVQPIIKIYNQGAVPSCVGMSWAAVIDSFTHGNPLCSGVSIWREARRRQGRIEQIERGTRLEYALDGLVNRGWDPYRPGEEEDAIEAGQQDDLADELFAHDKRISLARVKYRIDPRTAIEDVIRALARGDGVVVASGLREPYFHYRSTDPDVDRVLGLESRGGDENRHAERCFAHWRGKDGRHIFGLQGSYGEEDFGGMHLPTGQFLAGCVWVDEACIRVCHDVSVLARAA